MSDVTLVAIQGVGSRRYSTEQTRAWAVRHPDGDRFLERSAKGDWIMVAADETDRAVAYALLERGPDSSGHLDMLYCHPDHTRRGLADALLSHAEDHAKHIGLVRLFTEASELARAAFERAGYRVMSRRDIEIDGVPIHNFAMEKLLG